MGHLKKGKYAPAQNQPTTAHNGGGIRPALAFLPPSTKEVCRCGLVASSHLTKFQCYNPIKICSSTMRRIRKKKSMKLTSKSCFDNVQLFENQVEFCHIIRI
jgi:hypothetical protein